MANLQRVNLLLERRQREALEALAHKKGRSISDLVREYITVGIESEQSPQQERMAALESARELTRRICNRRGGKSVADATEVIDQIREERTNELPGN